MDSLASSLSSSTGLFRDPAMERAYEEDAWPRLSHQLRWILGIAGPLYLAGLSLNFGALLPEAENARFAVRYLAVGLCLLGSFLASRRTRWTPLFQVCVSGTTLAMVLNEILEARVRHSLGSADDPRLMVMMIIVITYLILAGRLAWAVSSAAAGSLAFLGYAFASGLPGGSFQELAMFILLANGTGYAFRMPWNRLARRDFALRRALEREVEERQRAEREARQASAAKSRFLTVMSHEIRTPLNGVLGGAQLLQETPLSPDQRQPLDIIAKSGHQLARLLDDVLDLARIETGRLDLLQAPFSPGELLAGIHAVLYPQALAKGLHWRIEHASKLPPGLVGDELRLRQVLLNLAGNAVKFTEQGEVVVSLQCEADDAAPGTVRCEFRVRDTGPGLGEEARTRVFEPFEQENMSIQRRHGGSGLGLAISRRLVSAMGGELRLDSRAEQGCLFSFALALPTCQVPGQTEAGAASDRSLAVLVVDDLEANLIVAAGLLASLGHRPRTAGTGAEALALLQHEAFDAALLDLHMKDMDGLTLFHRIRNTPQGRALPVFLATADTERTRIQACLDQGLHGVLPKPIRKTQLASLLGGVQPPGGLPRAQADPLLDLAHVRGIQADLGPDVWAAGVKACRSSLEASLAELGRPDRASQALHRLAGLAASYGLARLSRQVREAEARLAEGGAPALEGLPDLAEASMRALEATLAYQA